MTTIAIFDSALMLDPPLQRSVSQVHSIPFRFCLHPVSSDSPGGMHPYVVDDDESEIGEILQLQCTVLHFLPSLHVLNNLSLTHFLPLKQVSFVELLAICGVT